MISIDIKYLMLIYGLYKKRDKHSNILHIENVQVQNAVSFSLLLYSFDTNFIETSNIKWSFMAYLKESEPK